MLVQNQGVQISINNNDLKTHIFMGYPFIVSYASLNFRGEISQIIITICYMHQNVGVYLKTWRHVSINSTVLKSLLLSGFLNPQLQVCVVKLSDFLYW